MSITWEKNMQKMVLIVCSLLFSVSAIAAETSSIMIFTPDGRLLTKQEVGKIYRAAKRCDGKTSAAAPELARAADRGDETAKAALTTVHAFCLRGAIDDILAPLPPYPPEK